MPADPFDILLTVDPSGTPVSVPLMLVKPKDGGKQYTISEVGAPPPIRISELEASFRDYPAEVESIWAQSNFEDGLGFRLWDPENPGGYDQVGGNTATFIASGPHKIVPGPQRKTTGTVNSNIAPSGWVDFAGKTYLVQTAKN